MIEFQTYELILIKINKQNTKIFYRVKIVHIFLRRCFFINLVELIGNVFYLFEQIKIRIAELVYLIINLLHNIYKTNDILILLNQFIQSRDEQNKIEYLGHFNLFFRLKNILKKILRKTILFLFAKLIIIKYFYYYF